MQTSGGPACPRKESRLLLSWVLSTTESQGSPKPCKSEVYGIAAAILAEQSTSEGPGLRHHIDWPVDRVPDGKQRPLG